MVRNCIRMLLYWAAETGDLCNEEVESRDISEDRRGEIMGITINITAPQQRWQVRGYCTLVWR